MPYATIQTTGGYLYLNSNGGAVLSILPYRWRLTDYDPASTFFSYVWANDQAVVCDGQLLSETGRAPFTVSPNVPTPLTFEYAGSVPEGPVYVIRAQGLGIYQKNCVTPFQDGKVWFYDGNLNIVWGVKIAD
ncbi:hypothetical protein [Pandoraea pulmonicola]|uniref:Uncharacterized protein n=1 Tax=Pandoraea pulmonicola TaxID=93221 RepID=A0AAJ5D2Y9_PANPU|nr:hypothetical protein [Pandoraea pulmonicola]SUA93229.1 Uncharacterised protein [Pandoraea pulmonicola]